MYLNVCRAQGPQLAEGQQLAGGAQGGGEGACDKHIIDVVFCSMRLCCVIVPGLFRF